MSNIILSGLPDNVKLNKLVYLLRNLFHNEGGHKFWIKEMADIRGAELKSAKIEFYGSEQASKAATTLNGFVFRANNMRYPLTAQVDEERPRPGRREQEYDRFENRPSFSGYSRERSRSPIGAERECSKLDLELELLRKQRMLIEEERRLLLERKKLEMVKEFGPSALKEFKSRDGVRDRYYRPERPERPVRSEYRERRGGPQPWRPPPPPQYKGGKKLPLFSLPTKILIKQINNLLLNLTKSEKEAYLLKKLVRSTIRQRLIVAMDRKPHMNCASIVELYRDQYPESQDEELLKEHLKNLRACHLPDAFHIPQSKTGFKAKYSGMGPYDDDIMKKIGEHIGWVEQDIDNTKEGEANEEPLDKKVEYAASLGSSEVALALHDKNDEDWMDGEQGWDD